MVVNNFWIKFVHCQSNKDGKWALSHCSMARGQLDSIHQRRSMSFFYFSRVIISQWSILKLDYKERENDDGPCNFVIEIETYSEYRLYVNSEHSNHIKIQFLSSCFHSQNSRTMKLNSSSSADYHHHHR